ncbi:MAG TPA: hypothetical protein VH228_09490 [Nocardioides sp.]|nr:hypothetical protein [Nocardioides sp.]
MRLGLGERHDRAERLDQSDEVEAGAVRGDDPAVEVDVVVLGADHGVVEEREGDLVAGAVDDDVGLDARAVGEVHARPVEPGDRGLDRDVAVAEPAEQVVADRRVGLEDVVVGLGKAVVGHLPDRDPEHGAHRDLLEPKRPAGERGVGEVVGRRPEQVLRDHPRTATHGQVGFLGMTARLDRDVGGRVADPQHHHALALEDLRGAVVMRVQLEPRERLGARERRLRPARVPVVTVGDQDVVVVTGLDDAALVP